jgi:hypothetical protein
MHALKPVSRLTMMLLYVCLIQLAGSAQEKIKNTFGKVSLEDFTLAGKSPLIDSNVNAVILFDEGSVHFVGNKSGWFSRVYTRQRRIKILNKKALLPGDNISQLSVQLYGRGEHREKLNRAEGATYNLENGQIVTTKLSDKDIFHTTTDDKTSEVKFSLPGVKEGSIIEYTYTINSDRWYYIPSWRFQTEEYPCLFSQFQVDIPTTMTYTIVRQGFHPFAIDKAASGSSVFRIPKEEHGDAMMADDDHYSITTVKHTWTMKDIPAFGSEEYLTSANNYLDGMEFQLAGTSNGESTNAFYNSWPKATKGLLEQEDFGGALTIDNDAVNKVADNIGGDATSPLSTAKAVFYYVSHHYTCTNHNDAYIKTNLRDVVNGNSGTVGDINLLLIAILRRKELIADPVLLSTRESGFNLASYPMLNRLNYVIVRLTMDEKTYYLDAAHPELGFGQLAADCYNGHARIISKKDPGPVWLTSDSLKEAKTTMVLISPTAKNIEGTWQSTLGKEESYGVRKQVQQKGQTQFFKDIQTRWGQDMEISNGGIDSLDQPENPIKVRHDFAIRNVIGESLIYLNPILGDGWRQNPFKAADRKYPVEMPYVLDQTYLFTMGIPDGYVVDESPKSTRVALNGNQGSFEYLVQQSADQIQLRCRLKLNKAIFQPEDYAALRDFFAYVVKKENEQIVLKKK